jgi:putative transposase
MKIKGDSLVERAQDWRWSSATPAWVGMPMLDTGPVCRPPEWLEHVNTPQTEAEVEALRECTRRRRGPYGDLAWTEQAAHQLGLEASLRPRGRPRKSKSETPSLFVGG